MIRIEKYRKKNGDGRNTKKIKTILGLIPICIIVGMIMLILGIVTAATIDELVDLLGITIPLIIVQSIKV